MAVFSKPIESDSYTPLRVQVYRSLREAIVSGDLKPGERIVEDRVCAELGVSRSPLREALRKLEGEGLVSILPRKGAIVTEVTSRDGLDLFLVREALEGLAANQATQSISEEELAELEQICSNMEKRIRARDMEAVAKLNAQFHEVLMAASRNRWIKEFLTSVRAQIKRFYRTSIDTPGRATDSLAEHKELIAALRAGDPGRAEEAARQHVISAREAAISPSSPSPR